MDFDLKKVEVTNISEDEFLHAWLVLFRIKVSKESTVKSNYNLAIPRIQKGYRLHLYFEPKMYWTMRELFID